MSADLYPPNDIDSDWTFGQLEEYANQLYARAIAAEAERDSLRDQRDENQLAYEGALGSLRAAEALVDSLTNQRDQRPTVEDGLMLRGVKDALPETWHAGKPLDVRVRLLVEGWQNTIRVNAQLEAERDRARDYVASLHGAKDFEQLAAAEARVKALEQHIRLWVDETYDEAIAARMREFLDA